MLAWDVPNELHIMPWGPISLITLCSFPPCLSSPHTRQSENEKDWSFQIKDWQYLRKHLLYLLLSTSSITFSLPACPFVLFLIKKIFWITGQGYHHPIPRAVTSVTGCLVYLISSRTFHLLRRTLLQFEIVDQEIERFSIWQNVNTQKKLKSI